MFSTFHYYIVITHYYHYYSLLHVSNWATCRWTCATPLGTARTVQMQQVLKVAFVLATNSIQFQIFANHE